MRVVECVPNFSEGRDQKVIDAIAEAVRSVEGVRLLDVDPGKSTNRTVFTFVGEPEAVAEAAFQSIARAATLIDMRNHQGAHPRIGATDVCPFVPVAGVTMEDCVELAKRLGKRVGEELQIPVYLYAEAAQSPERSNLADVRQGEYEGLEARMKNGFQPDFGPKEFNASTGATVIGARRFLIAYNVDLNTKSTKLANEVALNIREAGRAKRDAEGNIVKDEWGVTVKVPGVLKACKAVGWYVDEYEQAQISINLVDYNLTSVHQAFDECCSQAEALGMRVTGSEIVGLVPLEPMLMAGEHYLRKQGRCIGVSEKELVNTAVLSMGLSDVQPFDPKKKIIEYTIADEGKLLCDLSVRDFVDELASDSPAPGGGSVAALCGSLSAALSAMVANLTHGKKGFEDRNQEMDDLASAAQKLKASFVTAIDEDTRAFNKIGEARKLPKDTDEAKKARDEAIEKANQQATMVPLAVLRAALDAVELAAVVAERGNPNCLSDAGVAGLTARAGGEGAYYNVLINLPGLSEQKFVAEVRKTADSVVSELREKTDALHENILSRLSK